MKAETLLDVLPRRYDEGTQEPKYETQDHRSSAPHYDVAAGALAKEAKASCDGIA